MDNPIVISILSETSSLISKRDKESILLKNVISSICAFLNSDGGNLVLRYVDEDDLVKPLVRSTPMPTLIRKLEQCMITIIGTHQTASNINVKEEESSIVVSVKKSAVLITTNYNLYLPTETQVVLIASWESPQIILDDIIKRKFVPQAVQYNSHGRKFFLGKFCHFQECKSVQFRCLKSDRGKRTKLADRMTGKGNKFSCYVSAFANHQGGHIYYGIKDDGIVEGEIMSNRKEIDDITKKVEKTINKMTWPELIGQAKRGVQWDIFFEPVVDENNNVIPSTFVIVVYIAACLGGVFTEEPECYEMVEGKVEKMSFPTWKRRMLQPIELFHSREIPSMPQRIRWGSTRTQRICTRVDQLLTQSVNNGKSIELVSENLEQRLPGMVEVQLVILSKKVMVCYRSFCFVKAQELLKKYAEILTKTSEHGIFDAIRAYIEVAIHRAEGDVKALRIILADALDKADMVTPGLVTAGIYLLAATVASLFEKKEDAGRFAIDVLSIRALQHLQYVQDSPIVRADLEQKVHTTLAMFYLGCNISGVLTKPQVDSKSLEKAKSSVAAVNKSICEGNPMNRYREIQFNIVQAHLFHRHSQNQADREETFLKEAFNFSQKAICLASKYGFEEMVQSARACMALCTEDLVRTRLMPSHPSVKDIDFLLLNLEVESSEIKTHEIPTASTRLEPSTKEKYFLLSNAKDKSSPTAEKHDISTASTRLEPVTKEMDFLLPNAKDKSSQVEIHEIPTNSTRLEPGTKEMDFVRPNQTAESSQIEEHKISKDDEDVAKRPFLLQVETKSL